MASVQVEVGDAEAVSCTNEAAQSGPSQQVKSQGPNLSKAVADDIMLSEIEKCELSNLHNYYECKKKSCKVFSQDEEARQKSLKKRRFHHSWVEQK